MGVTVKEKVLGSGVFWVFINHKGKRKSKRVGSEEAALQVKSVIEAKLKLGQALPQDTPTAPKLSVYYEKYRQNYLETALRRTTRRRHEGNFRNYLLPILGHLRLDEITREKMQELIAGLVRKKLSKDSVRLIIAAICGLYTFAIENKVVKENPTIKLSKFYSNVRKKRDEIDPLTADEVSTFLRTVLNSKYYSEYYPVFLCDIHTGLRAGELVGLDWGDLDFNGKFMTIRRSIDEGRINLPKNGKVRRVDMSDALIEALQALKKARMEQWLAKGQNEIPRWVFCNQQGGILDANNLRNRALHKCLEEAKIRRIRLHDLRHTFASLLIQNGESLAYVKEQMGHSSIKVTVDVYGHLVPGANRQAVNKLPVAGKPVQKSGRSKKNLV